MNPVERELGPLQHVKAVNVARYMGSWYVIASIPTPFEKGAYNAIETYSWNQAEDRIDVDFRFNKDGPNGELKHYTQKAFIHDHDSNAEWRIQFFWPLKFAYLIIDLADDYSYTVVGVPNRKYVWIMARTPMMDSATYTSILHRLAGLGYDVAKIEKVPQVN